MADTQRKKASIAAQKRAGQQYEAQKQIAQYREEKRRAEEMLLMGPFGGQPMQEQPEQDEISAMQ